MDEIDSDQEHHGSVQKAACRLHGIVDMGVRRETFFYNQVYKDHAVAFTGVGDFVVDVRTGSVILIGAIAYFLMLAIDRGWIGPAQRVYGMMFWGVVGTRNLNW